MLCRLSAWPGRAKGLGSIREADAQECDLWGADLAGADFLIDGPQVFGRYRGRTMSRSGTLSAHVRERAGHDGARRCPA
jgi:hypothetical protein